MVHLMSLLKLITALCVATLSGATYVIDDTNTTIQYLPGGQQAAAAGVQWHIAQSPEVNISASYDQTSAVGECVTSQNCTMTIPFQGSGIEIMVVQVNYAALNVSIVVDTLLPSYHYYAEPQYYLHNFSLFQIQELPTGFHTVTIKLLDSQYASGDRYAYVNGTSALVFDYATVNEINIASGSTPSTAIAQPSATVSAVPTSAASKAPIGAIVGGIVGGIALLMAGILLYLCRHRIAASPALRRRRTEIDPEPKRHTLEDPPSLPPSAGPYNASFNPQNLYNSNSRASFSNNQAPYPQSVNPGPYPQSVNSGGGDMSEMGYQQRPSSRDRKYASGTSGLTAATELAYARFSGRASSEAGRSEAVSGSGSGSGSDGVRGQAPSVAPLGLRSGGFPSPSRSSYSQSAVSRAMSEIPSFNEARASQLTPEQLDFVHNLISLNVPAADIAGVMERMREEGEDGEANQRMGLGMERGVLGRGDVKSAPEHEALPDYEPPRQ
ncbi:hypothetical protein FIBSPDRAFT_1044709 [Athelia psychrophila]|uniref:Mid2 domain-containing protein n=1 Tax=Athelia psychrophila TaxID=1759441 RepID=A0A166JAX5_9AGAM|nr:hypothetical protein FIBSPDRAFT_1044709 [Fibularhizoctonia sp. CBS 109695]